MIDYRVFTKRDAIDWQSAHPPTGKLSDLRVQRYDKVEPDDVVAIVAIDDGEIVGRIFVYKSSLLIDGQLYPALASGDLYVREDYRSKSVGTFIKMRMLKIDMPQLVGGAGGAMRKIYEAWSKFIRVDDSLVYQLALERHALVFYARNRVYRRLREGGAVPRLLKLRETYALFRAWLTVRCSGHASVRILDAEAAVAALPEITGYARYRVQVPWDRTTLVAGLRHEMQDYHAWVVEVHGADSVTRHLLSVYMKPNRIRWGGKGERSIPEAHLNEIYPPPAHVKTAQQMLSALVPQLSGLGAGALHIHAIAEPLDELCRGLGLTGLNDKTVFFVANGLDAEVARMASDPANWWCRGINEQQFREAGRVPVPGEAGEAALAAAQHS